MSGSKDKRERRQQKEQGADLRSKREKQEEKERKRQRRTAIIFICAFVVLAVTVLGINSGMFYRQATALSVNGESFSVVEYDYYYYSAYLNEMSSGYGQYLIDSTKPLSSQPYTYNEEITWADYFKNTAFENMKSVKMLYDEAVASGMTTLNEEYQGYLDKAMDGLKTTASDNGFSSVGKYLSAMYGKGMNAKTFEELQRRGYIASQYSESIQDGFKAEYTDEDLEDYYVENADEFDKFTYRYYFVDGAEPAASEDEEAAVTEESMAAAKTIADAIAEAESEDEYVELVYEYADEESKETYAEDSATLSEDMAGSNLADSDYAEWLRDSSRKKGDLEVVETDLGYYVMYFIDRTGNDMELVNVRHILISPEAISEDIDTEDEEAVAAAEEEADAAALEEAESILKEWKDGDATEESFGALADEYSEDPGSEGGLYEDVYPGMMVTEFDEWIFDESRKPGDVELVKTEGYGYHIIYFIGHTGQTYRNFLAQQDKLSTDYEAWSTEKLESFSVTEKYFMRFAS